MTPIPHIVTNSVFDLEEFYDIKHHVYCWRVSRLEGISCLPEAALHLPDGGVR